MVVDELGVKYTEAAQRMEMLDLITKEIPTALPEAKAKSRPRIAASNETIARTCTQFGVRAGHPAPPHVALLP